MSMPLVGVGIKRLNFESILHYKQEKGKHQFYSSWSVTPRWAGIVLVTGFINMHLHCNIFLRGIFDTLQNRLDNIMCNRLKTDTLCLANACQCSYI